MSQRRRMSGGERMATGLASSLLSRILRIGRLFTFRLPKVSPVADLNRLSRLLGPYHFRDGWEHVEMG